VLVLLKGVQCGGERFETGPDPLNRLAKRMTWASTTVRQSGSNKGDVGISDAASLVRGCHEAHLD